MEFLSGPDSDLTPSSTGQKTGEYPIILHIDMDSFYASAELQRHPELRGRPVVVGADPKGGTGRGVACTCSYEARAYGIRSAMPVSQAFTLCPHAFFLPPDIPYYARISREIMELLRSFGFPMLQVSIDEAYLDVSSCLTFETARKTANGIQAAIHDRFGLTCSVGIAPGKILSKIASDFQKPGGLTIVKPGSVREFLAPLPVRKVPGIGERAETELLEMGVRTVGDLAGTDIQRLITRFGRSASVLHQLASGIDGTRLEEPGTIRSLSRENTFERDTDDLSLVIHQLDALVASVHSNLLQESLRCRTVTIKIRFQDFTTRTKSRTLPYLTDTAAPLCSCSRELLSGLFDGRKVRLIGIRLSSLEQPDRSQRTLGI